MAGVVRHPGDSGRTARRSSDRQHPHESAPLGGRRKRGALVQAIGISRGGRNSKLHALTDGEGRPLRFLLTGGQVHDSRAATALLDGIVGDAVIADKAYDSNAIRDHIAAAGMKAVIPSSRRRKVFIPHDAGLYRERNRIERCFNKLKHFRRLATRYDRRACHFLAFLSLAATMLWMR